MSHAESQTSQPPVGIDLGTTYSVVAYVDSSGRPISVPNGAGDLLTPSALLFEDNEIIVGKEAAKSSTVMPIAYADCFKRDMGGSSFRRKVRGVELPPEVLSGFVLERLKQDAERRLGPIQQVVITVPAFFDETRRKATQDAGRLAGFEVLDIINEPTAAAIAYGYQQGFLRLGGDAPPAAPQRVLVYDLGGGTFDVTVLEMEGREFRAVATDGDVRLGGKDFDERLLNHLAEQFVAAHGVDPRSDPEDAAQLWLDAQEMKHTLSERTRASVVCFHAGIRLRVEITREVFEELTSDLVARTETTTSLLIKQAGLNWSQIDHVLLVGGSSRIPMVVEMLRRLTGKEPDQSLSPDEAVAHGAALYAGILMQEGVQRPDRYRLVNVNSHSLGVVGLDSRTKRRTNMIVIPRNTALPCEVVKRCKTARHGQRSVMVAVVEGESLRPDDCIALGNCVIRDLPPGLPEGTPIQVEYRYAANGRIAVSARLPQTRQSAHVEIHRDHAHDLKDLASWRELLLFCSDLAPPAAPSPATPASSPSPAALQTPIATPIARPFAASDARPAGSEDASEKQLRELDSLYTLVGRAAVKLTLSPALAQCRAAARQAVANLEEAEKQLRSLESQKMNAAASPEAVQLAADVSQAHTRVAHSRSHAEFALLVLGRECIKADIIPRGSESVVADIRRLKSD